MPPMYEYLCDCGSVTAELVSYEKRDAPQTCATCGGQAKRAWLTPPSVRTAKTSASFIDGTKRFAGLKEQFALEQAKMDARPEERKEINKELDARKAHERKK